MRSFLAQHRVATLFGMVTTLFQYCNAVLRKKSSLRIVPCNIIFSCNILATLIQMVATLFQHCNA